MYLILVQFHPQCMYVLTNILSAACMMLFTNVSMEFTNMKHIFLTYSKRYQICIIFSIVFLLAKQSIKFKVSSKSPINFGLTLYKKNHQVNSKLLISYLKNTLSRITAWNRVVLKHTSTFSECLHHTHHFALQYLNEFYRLPKRVLRF